MRVIPIRALEHHHYCPRQATLIHGDHQWQHNSHTLRGIRGHRRTDQPGVRTERGAQIVTGAKLWSEVHGLTGRADTIRVHPDGRVQPIEYKFGTRHGRAAELQVCAQALCLEEMLDIDVTHGGTWFSATRRLHTFEIDIGLREHTVRSINQIRANIDSHGLPDAPNDERCVECQLSPHCTPTLVNSPEVLVEYISCEVYECMS